MLRAKRYSDVARDFAWRSDPELAELDATTPIRLSLDVYDRRFRDELEYPAPWSVRYAIETYDEKHIGNAMYYDIDRSKRECELGIMIGDRDYWGRGYGTDAVKTLLRSIFTEAQMERVYLHTLDYNERAQRSFRKAGFKDVKAVRRDRRDFLRMEVYRSDWLERFGDDPPVTATEPGADASAIEVEGPDATFGSGRAQSPE